MTREQFIHNYENWDSYKPLLWEALERTAGDIIEMGTGKGSTALLHEYSSETGRKLWSYEADYDWWKTALIHESLNHKVIWTGSEPNEWNIVYLHHGNRVRNIGVVFIDHAPGERRKVDINILRDVDIIVAHDTEPSADHGYQMRDEIKKFKYWRDFETPGAWASIMSNFVDVTKPL